MMLSQYNRLLVTGLGFILMVFFTPACEDANNDPNTFSERIDTMYLRYKADKFSDTPDVSAEKIQSAQGSENFILVDVREEKERAVSIIPGALDKVEFEKNIEQYKGQKIIVYCTIGYRSGVYTQKLRKKNFNAFNLKGGVLGWAQNKGDFVGPTGQATHDVHVYGKQWNLLPTGYKAIW